MAQRVPVQPEVPKLLDDDVRVLDLWARGAKTIAWVPVATTAVLGLCGVTITASFIFKGSGWLVAILVAAVVAQVWTMCRGVWLLTQFPTQRQGDVFLGQINMAHRCVAGLLVCLTLWVVLGTAARHVLGAFFPMQSMVLVGGMWSLLLIAHFFLCVLRIRHLEQGLPREMPRRLHNVLLWGVVGLWALPILFWTGGGILFAIVSVPAAHVLELVVWLRMSRRLRQCEMLAMQLSASAQQA